MNENLYLYILMRTDLPSMGAGRAAAQASHAANAFIHKFGGKADVKEWQKQTPQGFGTAIVLGVTFDQFQLKEKCSKAMSQGFHADSVIDPDYVISVSKEIMPFIDSKNLGHFEQSPADPDKYLLHREEVTCAYIFGDKEKLVELLGDLPLYS
jgi:peptidyl-tRNA hydrolase